MSVLFSMRHGSAGGAAARARSIVARFGVTAAPMEERLRRLDELTAEFGVRPSWAITACLLERNRKTILRFAERGVEFAIRGLVHDGHGRRSLDDQRASIARAAEVFRAAGVPCRGFRGPFLRDNRATDETVRELGLLYHSAQPVVFDAAAALDARAEEAFRRTLRHLYAGAVDADAVAVRPSLRGGVIHIPVALPDDEVMVERLRLHPEQQAEVWREMLDASWRRGELFTVQLHPERTDECAAALAAILAEARARRPAVWIATLERIAEWWRRRAQTRLEVMPLEDGRYRVRMEGDPAATLLVRGLPGVDAAPWHGPDGIARAAEFQVMADRKPVVGVSARTPSSVLTFLAEEGFPAERGEEPARFGAWVDVAGQSNEKQVLQGVESCTGPLVRLGRWPAGARSALSVTGDIDCMTLQDFALRLWETRR
ncbi:MAG: polysaccharide deacetylase family protein [Gemmatimonadetes bacterium]|nr:polysaccharide deacetylase family protein [Gemmatimonadota bacterium]